MRFIPTEIPDVIEIEPDVFGDQRGFFMEIWQRQKFAEAGIDAPFVQDNQSRSAQGILRGLHYQIRQPQGKLVRVMHGAVFDVVVDLRKSSATFGKWVSCILSDDNKKMLWVPPGFAHGFYVISERVDFLYKCTEYYAPEFERSIRWDDEDLAIDWPLVAGREPVLAAKDAAGLAFKDAEYFV
jgi:dTDP-4-dehydrorhamnose 3,5-epimerase